MIINAGSFSGVIKVQTLMKSEPLKIGLTGGIGSGKTTVAQIFGILGVPVFSADNEAKRLMDEDPYLKSELCRVTGQDLYKNGNLDRKLMASLIFNDNDLLDKVNKITHPAVFNSFLGWAMMQTAPYVIMEAAILFESGASKLVSKVVTISAPANERINRVMLRNELSKDDVTRRLNAQMSDEERINLSDYVIFNSESDMVIPAVLEIHEKILNLVNV